MDSKQGYLFDAGHPSPPVRRDAPETSHAAAASIASQASRLGQQVFDAIRQAEKAGAGGLTCCEIEARLEMSHQTASARVWELRKLGLVADSGKRRPTRSGRAAIVWRPASV